MKKYTPLINIGAPSPLMYDFIFGTTYIGFKEYKENYVKINGEVGAIMQVVHRKIKPKTLGEHEKEGNKITLLKKL